ncbi:AAA family ATPase [Delftia lacustris]
MNRRNDAAHAAVDANVAAALAYRPPARTVQPPQEPTFPPLDSAPEDVGTQPGTRPGTHGNTVVLTCGTDLNPEPVRWLWQHWLALGKLHILAGAPGQGKTTLALTMAATVTIGGQWPDKTRCDAGNVLIWSGEDDPADTLLPRLLAAGAERARCFFIEGARTPEGEVQPFDPARDLQGLLQAIQHIGGVRLLVIDPVVSAVTGDSHKNTEVRRALQPLVNLATACDCAVLGITHFAKGGQGVDPAQRVVGSVAFTAVARVVLVAAKVKSLEDGQDARILARSKSNIGPDDGGFTYHLEQCEPLPGIQASRIAWGVAMQGSARDLLTDPNEEQDDEGNADATAKDVAAEFLGELLRDGPAPSKYVEAEAKAAGISWMTVRRASDALGIRKRRIEGAWYWLRPEASTGQVAQLAHVAHVSDVEQVEQVDEQVAQKSNLLIQDAHVAHSQKREQVEQHEQVAQKTGTAAKAAKGPREEL